MTIRSSMPRLILAATLLLVALAPAMASAQRRVAVVKFKGGNSTVLRGAVMTSLSDKHTVVLPNEVDAKAKEVGLTPACKKAKVAALGVALKAEGVVCGATKGVPWRRRFTLTVYNGADGKKLGTAAVILRKSGLTETHMKRMTPKLHRALVKATAMEAPEEPGAGAAAAAPLKPVAGLARALSSPVLGDRLDAVRELARHRNWQAAPAMSCAMLRDSDLDIRELAIQEMSRAWHDQVVLAALEIAAAVEPDAGLRRKAKAGLAALKAEVPGLLSKLTSPDQEQRLAAVTALAMAGYREALSALVQAAEDVDSRVRLFALQGLRTFPDAAARNAIKGATVDLDGNVSRSAKAFLDEQKRLAAWRVFHMSYIKVIKKTSARLASWRADGAIALGLSGADTAIPRLEELLRSDKVASVRLAAAWTLTLLNTPRSLAAVRNSSRSDNDPRVRRTCGQFLKAKSLNMEQLLVRLNDNLAEFRLMAAQTVALRPTARTVPYLARTALCDPDPQVRMAALAGLAREGSKRSLGAIKLAMFRDSSDDVRRFSMMLYVLVGWEEPEPDKAVASKETASWMSDAEDPLAAERRREEAKRKAKEAEELKAKDANPRCPIGDCWGVKVMVGASALFVRHFGVDVGDVGRAVDGEAMTTTPVAGIGFGFELYPGAFFTNGWLSNLGVALRYSRSFGLSWKSDKAADGDEATGITHQVISADFLRFRLQPVRGEKIPTLNFRFGLNHQEFLFNDSDGFDSSPVPDLTVQSLVLGLNIELPVRAAKMMIGFDYLPVLSWGELTEPTPFRVGATSDQFGALHGYGDGSGYALQAMLGFRGPIGWKIGWQLEAIYNYYSFSFDQVSDRKAEGSQDHFVSGVLYLTFSH